jgi:phosphatidylglycerophosphate synthase
MRVGSPTGSVGRVLINVPNAVTLIRTVVAMVLATAAITGHSLPLLLAGYGVYWIGDILDGALARRLGQETRAGAVFDIVADRGCTALCASALIMLRPDATLPVAVFLVQFMVIDCLLGLAFLRWPLLSPNYFGRVHRQVYLWNWSPPAKALNTGGLVGLVLLAPLPAGPAVFAFAVLVVKIVSLVTVSRLPTAPMTNR